MSRAPRGARTLTVEVAGVSGIRSALGKWLDPELTRELDAANRSAARMLARELKAEARPLSRRMASAVRVRRARTGKPGWVVGSSRKRAYFWHMVIAGTRDHGPRKARRLVFTGRSGAVVTASRVRGVPAHPIVDRVAQRFAARAVQQIDSDMTRMTGT